MMETLVTIYTLGNVSVTKRVFHVGRMFFYQTVYQINHLLQDQVGEYFQEFRKLYKKGTI